jgi:gluconate kinase
MLLVFFGPSCSGKSTVAKIIAERTTAGLWTGKDYLRLAPNEPEAKKLFMDMLRSAAEKPDLGAGSVIHVVTDPGQADSGIVGDKVITVKFTAQPDILQARFRKRTGGQLQPGVAEMLDRQLQKCGTEKAQLKFDTSQMHPEIIADAVMVFAQSRAVLPDRPQSPQ